MRCARCELESNLERHFKPGHWGFAKKGRICPLCRIEVASNTFDWVGTLGVLLFGGVIIWLARLESDSGRFSIVDFIGPFFRCWLLLLTVPIALMFAHELVHALAAWLVGARVYEIRFGWGAPKRVIRVGRVRLTYAHDLSSGGYCVVGAPRGNGRWRRLAIWGAPLLLHVAAAAALAPLMVRQFGSGGHMELHIFYAVNLVGIAINTFPRNFKIQGQALPNDGKALIALARGDPAVKEWDKAEHWLPSYYAFMDGDYPACLRMVQELAERDPGDPLARIYLGYGYWYTNEFEKAVEFVPEMAASAAERDQSYPAEQIKEFGVLTSGHERVIRGHLYVDMERYEDAAHEFRAGLDEETAEERRASWKAYVAYAHYLGRNPEGAVPAREAYAAMPWSALAVAARASWLIESGDPERALDVINRRTDPISEVEQSMHLLRAEAYARLGKIKEGRRHYEAARGAHLPRGFRRRVEEALKAAG